jgi:hypothetical protein
MSGNLTTGVIAFSVLMAVVLCASVFLAPNQHNALEDAMNGVRTTGNNSQVLSSLALLAEIGAWVAGALWLTRARQNALAFRLRPQRRSEVWVWLAWVVPVVNLWFPKQLLDDTIAATALAGGTRPIRTGTWWAAWIGAFVLGITNAVINVFPPNDSLHLAGASAEVLLLVLALALWLRIVRRVSADQDALAAGRPPGQARAPY